jgi:hypothetical protein
VSVCVSPIVPRQRLGKVYPTFTARQWPGNHVPAAKNARTPSNRRVVERVCLWVCLCSPLSFLGKNSVKTSPRQRGIVGGVNFYAVRDVKKESTLLVLPRIVVNVLFAKRDRFVFCDHCCLAVTH